MSDNIICTADTLTEAVRTHLDNYNRVVVQGIKAKAKEAIDKLVQRTKETAPKRRPKYYRAITSRKEWETAVGIEYTWYVKGSEYRLSHLLEHGHATRRKRNGKGRTAGIGFIKNASDPIIEEYIQAVEEVVTNG